MKLTKKIRKTRIGSIVLDGKRVYIEAMVKSKTSLYRKTLHQAIKLEEAGAEIIRFAVKDKSDLASLRKIKKSLGVPIIADVHFDYKTTIACLDFADCVRLNPLNIPLKKNIIEIARVARKEKRCIRVGVNSGGVKTKTSLKKELKQKVQYALKTLEDEHFFDIMISAKSSSVEETLEVNRFLAGKFLYPFHIGITASGPGLFGIVKSCVGIGSLLAEGIGQTIRVSLTDSALREVLVSKYILQALGKRRFFAEIISCPTCGRAQKGFLQQVLKAAKLIESSGSKKRSKVAIMGCEVNGPGESRDADFGFAFSHRWATFFKKGKIVKRVAQKDFLKLLEKEIEG